MEGGGGLANLKNNKTKSQIGLSHASGCFENRDREKTYCKNDIDGAAGGKNWRT